MTTQTEQTVQQQQQFHPVLPGELNCPDLSPAERHALWLTLSYASCGGRVWAACDYPKQTEADPRVEDVDYNGLPGVSPRSQIGPVVRVFRTKDGALRFTIFSITRYNFTTIIPDGLKGFRCLPPVDLALTRPQ